MSASFFLVLRDGYTFHPGAAEQPIFRGWYSELWLPRPAEVWAELAGRGGNEDDLVEKAVAAGDVAGAARFAHRLRELIDYGVVLRSVVYDDHPLATLEPQAHGFRWGAESADPDQLYTLSRFAYLRAAGGKTIAESPRSFARVVLHDPLAAAALLALASPGRPADVARRVPGLPVGAVGLLVRLLAAAGLVVPVSGAGLTAEDAPPLFAWEFHDLLFHSRSRVGRHPGPVAATYHHAGRISLPPALKPLPEGERIALCRPDLRELAQSDPPFTTVMERRQSVRSYGPNPLTLAQLGECLFRVGGIRRFSEFQVETPAGPVAMEFAHRPYPNGGAIYELEMYPVVRRCDGLSPGLYHYDAAGHQLTRVSGPTPAVEALLDAAATSAGLPPTAVQVLLVLTSRLDRVAWKYAAMAYALTLKHVGVVYQTLYLTATAMGLAPCGLGAGNSDLFAQAAGTDYYAEPSVGEFLLGGSPISEPAS